jgi:predicted nucleic acid-binding protein
MQYIHKIRVYVDTSIFGGTEDIEFAEASRKFFERAARGDFIILLSAMTLQELSFAPEGIKCLLDGLESSLVENIALDLEVQQLAQAYIEAGVLSPKWEGDCLHVAAATVAGAELILSWNFKHIVNYNRIRGFNSVNIGLGYRSMTILSPLEVVYGDYEETI